MSKIFNMKEIEIPTANRVYVGAEVLSRRYRGYDRWMIPFIKRGSHCYHALVKLDGLDKPVKLWVRERERLAMPWNYLELWLKWFILPKHINKGDRINVVCDRENPKRIMLVER